MNFYIISEWLGVITALIYVYLASKGSRWCFLYGLISSILFTLICFNDKLYFDTIINLYYIVMSFVGWFVWEKESGGLKVISMRSTHFFGLLVLSLVLAVGLGFFTNNYTDASLPYLDSTTTVLAVLATWMLVKKAIQNWIVWIIADGISVVLYIIKDHYPIALLFLVYTVIAAYGYFHWKGKLKTV